jgi:Cu-Zn family superoxide dismutase
MKAIAVIDPRVNNGISGTIHFTQTHSYQPLEIFFTLKGFEPFGIHAIHIHEFGDLTEGCKSLGGHFNPTQTAHSHSGQGHAGDLFNNFQADPKGNFIYCYKTRALSLDGINNIIGRSIVIHKFVDDLGLMGRFDEQGIFTLYEKMSENDLRTLYKQLGYTPDTSNTLEIIQRLKKESATTGNAATRIACAIVGWSS